MPPFRIVRPSAMPSAAIGDGTLLSRTPVALRLGVRSRRLLLRIVARTLLPGCGLGNHFLHEFLELDRSFVSLVAAPNGDGPLLRLTAAENEHVRDLEKLGVTDLRAHLLLAQVGFYPDAAVEQDAANLLRVRDLGVGDRDEARLDGCQPQGKIAAVMLDEGREETLQGAEERAVDHEDLVFLAVRVGPG